MEEQNIKGYTLKSHLYDILQDPVTKWYIKIYSN